MTEIAGGYESNFVPIDGQKLVSTKDYNFKLPDKHLSVIEAVKKLNSVKHLGEIGLKGPPNAAASTEQNQEVPELDLYEVFFVRDAHITSFFLRERFPQLTDATISEALKFTGVRENLRPLGLYDEQELWKTPHEIRDAKSDPIAQELIETKHWGWPYYGAMDTTLKNINAICDVALTNNNLAFLAETYTGLDGKSHSYGEALQGHINWMRKRMDLNNEGLLEALKINPHHHANQTWTDSPDGFHHKDGSWAKHHPDKNWGVAPLELQAEAYDALINTSNVYIRELKSTDLSSERQEFLIDEIADLSTRAEKLRNVVLDKFWVVDEKGGYFARATDRDESGSLRPLEIRSSDMGHLLNSNLLDGNDSGTVHKRNAVIETLFSPEMLCPSGIRTLSSDSVRYFEDAYHNGNSWPWQTYYIALGLERHEYYGLANELKKRAFSVYEQTKILPEYATGSGNPNKRLVTRKIVIADESLGYKPTYQISQPPQEIQAWTAAAILAMKYENGKRLLGKNAHPTTAQDPVKLEQEQRILSTL